MRREDIKAVVINGCTKRHDNKLLTSLGYQVIATVYDGIEALDIIRSEKPQLILGEPFFSGIDFYGILDELNGYNGVFICISSTPNDKLAARLMKKGADYFCLRSLKPKYVGRLIDSFLEEKFEQQSACDLEQNEKQRITENVSEMLQYIGMPTNLLGYNYIKDSVIMAIEDEGILRSFSDGLYREVAGNFHTNPKSVERAIRTAICTAWNRGDYEAQLAVFGYTISDDKGKPTNSEFITKIVEKVRLKLAAQ